MIHEPTGLDVKHLEPMECPFCGLLNPHVFQPSCSQNSPYNPGDTAFPIVRCRGCYATVGGDDWDRSCKSAVLKWNARVSKPLPVEAIESAVRGLQSYVQEIWDLNCVENTEQLSGGLREGVVIIEGYIADLRALIEGAKHD